MDLGICVGVLLLRSRLYNYAGVPLSPLNIEGEIESQRISHADASSRGILQSIVQSSGKQ